MKDKRLDEFGREVVDPNPIEVPAGFGRPETLQESIARIVATSQAVAEARKAAFETFEEADDFDIPEDDTFDPETPFEQVWDPVLEREVTAAELLANPQLYQRLYQEAASLDVEASSAVGEQNGAETAPAPADAGDQSVPAPAGSVDP